MTRLRAVALLGVLCLAKASWAQEEPAPERLYLTQSALTASPRIVALGGAYNSIAEGAEAIPSNVAALAHRPGSLKGNWQFDATFSLLDLPIGNPERRDLDNDGIPDRGRSATQYFAAAMLQIRRVGVGGYYRWSNRTFCSEVLALCPAGDYLNQWLGDLAFSSAASILHDDLIIGGALHLQQAAYAYDKQDWYYAGWGWELDALYRPNGLPVRMGITYRSETVSSYQPKPGQASLLAPNSRGERRVYSAVLSPSVLTIGASFRLGTGASLYNRLSPKAREVMLEQLGPQRTPSEVPQDTPDAPWLISMQADLIFPAQNAVSTVMFTTPDANPSKPGKELIGEGFYVVPRLGIENDTIQGRLRLRIGGYFEPSPFKDRPQRAHLTGGFMLRLFRLLVDWSAFASADFGFNAQNLSTDNISPNYQYIALGVSLWDGPKDPARIKKEREAREAERMEEERERQGEEDERRREREQEEKERREREQPPEDAPREEPKVIQM